MKKNISINISGIIFHIEEDGYEALKKYLESINRYFASFDDSSEILADIESRIAEIFLSKLHEGKQVITREDVSSLITTMGSVSDFKAAEEQEFAQAEKQEEPRQQRQSSFTPPQEKRFMRDQKRKILGGVCSGLGNYFNVDPVWIRILFALLVFGYGLILIAYVVLWIVIPGSYELEETPVSKKLYRDADKRVIGGVAGGLAAYLNMDIVVVRLIFVISIFFGGLGLIAYIVFWIVVPEARSLTEKMEMQGEPVTLSNIESNVKKSQDEKISEEEESALVKILLFPFRAIGWLLTSIGKILSPLVDVLRVGVGVLITFFGLGMVVFVLIAGGILIGLFTFSSSWILGWEDVSLPMEAISRIIPSFTAFMLFMGSLVPGIIVLLLGVSVIAQRIVFNAVTGWTLFVMFFISGAVLSVSIPKIAMGFKEHGEYKVEQTYNIEGTPVLKLREVGLDDYDAATVTLKGYEGTSLKLVQYFEAKGNTKMKAIDNAQMVGYMVDQSDSVLTFDSNIHFKEDAIFRAQRLKMTLFVPFNQPFVMEDDFWRLLNRYIDHNKREGHSWKITEDAQLECTTCPEEIREKPLWDEDEPEEDNRVSGNYTDFKELEISGIFDLRVTQGNEFSVELSGPAAEKAKYRVARMGNILVIDYDDERKLRWNKMKFHEVRIRITMPELDKVELKGAGKASFYDFTEDYLKLKVFGAIKVNGKVNARDLSVYLSGASEMVLSGEGNTMDAKVLGASQLKGYDFKVTDAVVEANGASRASVHVSGRLEIDEGLASKVSYRGNPQQVIKD
jgi:phage shock protein PspC (stress-responsive transcriptional regulator)